MALLRPLRALALLLLLVTALAGCCPPALQGGAQPAAEGATSFAAVVEESAGDHARARLPAGTPVRLDLRDVPERPQAGARVYVEGTLTDASTVRVARLSRLGTAAAAPR